MADVEFERTALPDETQEVPPLSDDPSFDALFERSPQERQAWIGEHPEEWAALREQARPHVRLAFDPKELAALTSTASERPAERQRTLDRAVELLDAAHQPGGALELDPESLKAMKERVVGLTGRASLPTADAGGDLLQQGAIAEAQRDLAELEAMVAVIESELLSVSWRPPPAIARRETYDRWGDLVIEEGGREVARLTPAELAERESQRATEAAEGEDYADERGIVTIEAVRSWDRAKQLRFRAEFPDAWEALKVGPSISGIRKRKGAS